MLQLLLRPHVCQGNILPISPSYIAESLALRPCYNLNSLCLISVCAVRSPLTQLQYRLRFDGRSPLATFPPRLLWHGARGARKNDTRIMWRTGGVGRTQRHCDRAPTPSLLHLGYASPGTTTTTDLPPSCFRKVHNQCMGPWPPKKEV